MLLLTVSSALAVPKAFSESRVLLAVAPDARHVLVGTLGSFESAPRGLVERDVVSGGERALPPEVEAAFATCTFDTRCDALDAAWIPGSWVVWSDPPLTAPWTLAARTPDGWSTVLAGECANEGTVYTPCQVQEGSDTLDVRARADGVRVTLTVGGRSRAVRFSSGRLARLGMSATGGGVVVWGTAGVLVAFGEVGRLDGGDDAPVLAFVLPAR